jgi:hypothetical protein
MAHLLHQVAGISSASSEVAITIIRLCLAVLRPLQAIQALDDLKGVGFDITIQIIFRSVFYSTNGFIESRRTLPSYDPILKNLTAP